MSFLLSDLFVNSQGFVCVTAAIVTIILLVSRFWGSSLDAIPTAGSKNWLGSLWAGARYHLNAASVIQEGYEKYKFSPFKVADRYRWIVVLKSREHIEELLRASDDDFSFLEPFRDRFQMQYILPQEFLENRYHVKVIRSQLTRSIGAMCPVIRDEIVTAFDEVLNLKDNEWKSVPALSIARTVVCRTSNRLFVGLPLCRDPQWIDLNIQFAIDFATAGTKIGLYPKFMRPIAARFVTDISRYIERGHELLGPIIEERLKSVQDHGNQAAELPNDLLSWLIEEAKGAPLTVESLTARVLTTNFAAIHTTSTSLTHALFQLAENPQYIQPLREEVEAIVQREGWTKVALVKMRKIDSFLKESQRLASSHFLGLMRKAMKDYTFADGTFIPKGTTVGIGARAVHRNDTLYENANAFEPFRFMEMGNEDGEGAKHRFVSTGADYLPFGHGKHACPGRFFAANELKCLLAHVVTTYDLKLDSDTTGPHHLHVGIAVLPNPRTRVLFRKRAD